MSTNEVDPYAYGYWPKSLIDHAYAAYKQVPPHARHVGYWVVHPTTFDELRKQGPPPIGFDPDYPMMTLFGRPVHTSGGMSPGVFYFETEPDEFPPVTWEKVAIAVTEPYVYVLPKPAEWDVFAENFTHTTATLGQAFKEMYKAVAHFPAPAPIQWSTTLEPDWLLAMAEEMAVSE